MTAPSCTCGRCHHCGRLLAVDEHSAVCGNGQCPREDTDIDANENGERGSPYFGDCPAERIARAQEQYDMELSAMLSKVKR